MISDVLLKLRKEHNYTQQQVADGADMDQQVYSRYESGKRTPVAESIVKLAKFYGVTTDCLLGITDEAGKATPSLSKPSESDLDSLPPDLRSKAKDYIAMLKQLDEARTRNATADDVSKHA